MDREVIDMLNEWTGTLRIVNHLSDVERFPHLTIADMRKALGKLKDIRSMLEGTFDKAEREADRKKFDKWVEEFPVTEGERGWLNVKYKCEGCGLENVVGFLPLGEPERFLTTSSYDYSDCSCMSDGKVEQSPTQDQTEGMMAAAYNHVMKKLEEAEHEKAKQENHVQRDKLGQP
ncbi:MAG: hypothetical protein OXG15_02475 [Gammaproteobacteria bacterium]|nr:hypothetical protein [Gammaproteobacteria bacterium]